MLTLRPFLPSDADRIVSWAADETAFRKWTADRFERYPIQGEDLIRYYAETVDRNACFPFTARDENGPLGHLLMRYPNGDKREIRFGFVIVDQNRRRQGLGKEMLNEALRRAFCALGAEKVTLGVFRNNPPALACYRSVGFGETGGPDSLFPIGNEQWECAEMEITRDSFLRSRSP